MFGVHRNGEKYRAAGYVKLAKLWEKDRESIIPALDAAYRHAFAGSPTIQIMEVFVDITGKTHIYDRKEMVRLLRDCASGKIEVIISQTQAYLAANALEFFYLAHFVMTLPMQVELITDEDSAEFKINTIAENGLQRNALYKMSCDVIELNKADYQKWKGQVLQAISKLEKAEKGRKE